MLYLSGCVPVTTFCRCTRFSCRQDCSTRSSLTDVIGMPVRNTVFRLLPLRNTTGSDNNRSIPSFSRSILSFLRATSSPVRLCFALSAGVSRVFVLAVHDEGRTTQKAARSTHIQPHMFLPRFSVSYRSRSRRPRLAESRSEEKECSDFQDWPF